MPRAGSQPPLWASPLMPCSPLAAVFLFGFLASTPVAAVAVFVLGGDRMWWATWNSATFSVSYCLLYVFPLLWPTTAGLGSTAGSFASRLALAQRHWIVWLSCFTELVFQLAHNLCVRQLDDAKGTVLEWPFFAYGLSDSRWSTYRRGDTGEYALAPAVQLINYNDFGLGLLVALALLRELRARKPLGSTLTLVLLVVFRDATLWRETVEYMWDHHRLGYSHTTSDPLHRSTAIFCLWSVNVMWLVAPLLSLPWALHRIRDIVAAGNPRRKKS